MVDTASNAIGSAPSVRNLGLDSVKGVLVVVNEMWLLQILPCIEVPRQMQPRVVNNGPWIQRMVQCRAGAAYCRWLRRRRANSDDNAELPSRTAGRFDGQESQPTPHT